MATDKILKLGTSGIEEISTVDASAGAGDAGKIPSLDASGKIAASLLPSASGDEILSIEASETIAAGDLINLHDSSGMKARKADNSNARPAHGFALAGITSGVSGDIYFEGALTGLSGMTLGAMQYLGVTGGVTETIPTTAGYIAQSVGIAVSATQISFEPGQVITRV